MSNPAGIPTVVISPSQLCDCKHIFSQIMPTCIRIAQQFHLKWNKCVKFKQSCFTVVGFLFSYLFLWRWHHFICILKRRKLRDVQAPAIQNFTLFFFPADQGWPGYWQSHHFSNSEFWEELANKQRAAFCELKTVGVDSTPNLIHLLEQFWFVHWNMEHLDMHVSAQHQVLQMFRLIQTPYWAAWNMFPFVSEQTSTPNHKR